MSIQDVVLSDGGVALSNGTAVLSNGGAAMSNGTVVMSNEGAVMSNGSGAPHLDCSQQ